MAEEFPGGGRRSQPTVLVSGAASDLLERVPIRLFADRTEDGDGAVVVTTREHPTAVAQRLAQGVAGLDPDRLAVVDGCTADQAEATVRDGLRWSVRSPVAFDAISRAVRSALTTLADRGVERVHFLFDTLSSPFRLAAGDAVLDHAHEVAMTVGSHRGLGVFTVEEPAVTGAEAERLKHLVDVHVEVRRGDDAPEVRWSGLVGGSNGWVGLGDAGPPDALGTNLG